MLFNSIEFLLFFPAAVLVYAFVPARRRCLYLAVVSYLFYMGWAPPYALLLLAVTGVTYLTARCIARCRDREDAPSTAGRVFLIAGLTVCLGLLVFFKYANFLLDNVQAAAGLFGLDTGAFALNILLPVGISFYIFQVVGYLIDVYRGKVEAERNFVTYAAFVAFFPQLLSGPIGRAPQLLPQFRAPQGIRYANLRDGLMLMVWGFFQKIVIADRAAILVNQVYNFPSYYGGAEILVATLLFAVQIYGDFAGYSNIAIGAAKCLGFDLMDNFRRPYMAVSVADFWRRWHISLSSWFRDYLYIPLGGSRKGANRKYVNLMVVFLVSGLWHGSAWTYIVWGLLNGAYQVVGALAKPLRDRFFPASDAFSRRLGQRIVTFLLISLSWLFFRANSMADALLLLSRLPQIDVTVFFSGELLQLGLNATEWLVLFIAIGVQLVVSILQERGIRLRAALNGQQLWFRWLIVTAGIMAVLIFGIYGPGFDGASFIYLQF